MADRGVSEEFGWPALGAADGPVKRAILGGNSARLYGFKGKEVQPAARRKDRLAFYKAEHGKGGGERSNAFYGFINKRS